MHALAFPLIALQSPNASFLVARAVLPAPPAPTCSLTLAFLSLQRPPPGSTDTDRGLRAFLLAGAWFCVRFQLWFRVRPGPPGWFASLSFGLHPAATFTSLCVSLTASPGLGEEWQHV